MLMNALWAMVDVTLMHCVLTLWEVLPVPATLDTVEMGLAVQVRIMITVPLLSMPLSSIDINECDMNNGGCDFDAHCTNTIGSFTCVCNSGFAGNGISCMGKDYDHCLILQF